MPTPPAVLQKSLERHNETFESLLKLIPPKYYIVSDGPNDLVRAFLLIGIFTNAKMKCLRYLGIFEVLEEQQKQEGPKAGCKGGN